MDVEKFIELVKSKPILYDRRLKSYNNIQRKARIWEVIAREMNESSEVLRVKWKGLKDSYTKYKRQVRNKAAGRSVLSTYYNWCWAENLQFLDRCVRKAATSRTTPSSFDHSLSETPAELLPPTQPVTTTSISTTPPQTQIYFMESPQNEIVSEAVTPNPIRTQPELESPLLSKPPHTRSFTSKRSHNSSSVVDDDEKIHFIRDKRAKSTEAVDHLFKSYAETFKTFSHRKQVSMKMQLAKLFADAEMEEMQESSIEFVTPAFLSGNFDGEHDYASDNGNRHRNYGASCDVLEQTEQSLIMKLSPESDDSTNYC